MFHIIQHSDVSEDCGWWSIDNFLLSLQYREDEVCQQGHPLLRPVQRSCTCTLRRRWGLPNHPVPSESQRFSWRDRGSLLIGWTSSGYHASSWTLHADLAMAMDASWMETGSEDESITMVTHLPECLQVVSGE